MDERKGRKLIVFEGLEKAATTEFVSSFGGLSNVDEKDSVDENQFWILHEEINYWKK